jgi:hypothetical protein
MVARKQESTPDQTLLLRASNRERHGPFEIAKSFYAYLAADIIPILTQWMSKLEPKINSGVEQPLVSLLPSAQIRPPMSRVAEPIHKMAGWLLVINCKMVAALEHTIGLGCAPPCPRAAITGNAST